MQSSRSFPVHVLTALIATALALSASLHAQEARLANLSTRAQVGSGQAVLTAGFAIAPGANKEVLIRAVGPTLTNYGLSGVLANPVLTLFNSQSVQIASNDNWAAADAATFSAVQAFPLNPGSPDAAIVTTLAPGNYTAQVTSADNTSTGLALVEVYEVGANSAQLINISTRAQVGTGASVMVPGIVITGSGTRRLLIRAAGPALQPFGVTNVLADPTVTIMNAVTGATIAANNNWGAGATDATVFGGAFAQAGAFAFSPASLDAALLADLPAGSYGIQVSGVGSSSGIALVEVYDITPPGGIATVTVHASKASTDETGSTSGEFTLIRSGDTLLPLTVKYGISGSATTGLDYPPLLGTATIPSGASSATIPLLPYPDTTVESTELVTLTIDASPDYNIGATASASVSIADSPGTLYVASLRPPGSAPGSAASGLATIVLSASGTVATVNVSFSNLSAGQTGAHLFLGNSTSDGDYVLNLPLGQVTGAQWTILPTGTYTSTQILDALRNGQIFVGLDTAQFPAGELRGAFATALGSQTFTAPAAPPAVALTNVTASDAARLLTQATFGPKKSEIDALTGGSIATWLDTQMALPATLHRTATAAEKAAAVAAGELADLNNYPLSYRQRAWFAIVLSAPDQLRQRVAFALSQILVVSDATANNSQTEPLAHYNDLLANHAFGNFRTLLEEATLSPVMGLYLSHLRNAKATTTTNPDENYAREVMQLFTIGLRQLHPDGTFKLDDKGDTIPTYDQTTITETAKVFTGWGFFSNAANPSFRGAPANYFSPMMLYPASHEDAAKTIVNGTVIPANLGGAEDLKRTLDALVDHPNCAPFICRQLIQRLVTDNPSPAYVYRVGRVFVQERNNPNQLGAVVRAILTDYEARSPVVADDPGYGKLKEPLLRYTAILRGFHATSTSGRNLQDNLQNSLAQAALRAPSVFNFFEPAYVYPGPLAAAGLVAPEFQITNDTTAISIPNLFRGAIFATATGNNAAKILVPNYSAEQALVSNIPALLDHLGLVMANGQLSAATRTRITTALNALATTTTALERAQTAVLLVATSPEGATQK